MIYNIDDLRIFFKKHLSLCICDYSHVYIKINGKMIITRKAIDVDANLRQIEVYFFIFKRGVLFSIYKSITLKSIMQNLFLL